VVLEYFDFSAWVDAHIEGVPFAEVKKRGELAKAK
jgi:hypothetical protein